MALRLQYALAAITGFIAIAKLDRFAFAGGSPGRHLCSCGDPVGQGHRNRQCGVAARVQNFKCLEFCNFRHNDSAFPATGPIVVMKLVLDERLDE